MKQLFLKVVRACLVLNLILFSTGIKAQVDSARLIIDNILQHVDKSQIPTGYLDEYGAQFANLKTYNGILLRCWRPRQHLT